MDHVERYVETFESLRRRKRWSTDANILHFAALTLAALEIDFDSVDLERTAKALVDTAGGFSRLNSPIRHAVAAIITAGEHFAQLPQLRRIAPADA